MAEGLSEGALESVGCAEAATVGLSVGADDIVGLVEGFCDGDAEGVTDGVLVVGEVVGCDETEGAGVAEHSVQPLQLDHPHFSSQDFSCEGHQ